MIALAMADANFYEFSQNNSGGRFVVNDKLCKRVIVEAESYDHAEKIGKSLGIYYDGVDKGIDCDCCGDRWYSPNEINLDKINENGWEVVNYKSESEWLSKYGQYKIAVQPKWENKTFNAYRGKISFKDIEEYIDFLNREFGFSDSISRIFYLDGTVKEFKK